jgi:hypothetical protein
MKVERLLVAQAVLDGQLGQEYLSQKEVDEMMELVADAAMQKLMDEAEARGCTVFSGFEDESIH